MKIPAYPVKSVRPPYLRPGDTVAITCPASRLPAPIDQAVRLLESWGLRVLLGESVHAAQHQYAGSDELRRNDLQRFLDDREVKAVFAARGGYGTIRIIDQLDFSSFRENPKWLVGFSDVTVLHSHIQAQFGIETIHGQMPINIPDASSASLKTLKTALFGEELRYEFESRFENRSGESEGILTGGNLCLFMMMNGSVSEQDLSGKILFLEDVGEYLYSIDRMMWHLRRAGKLSDLAGLVVGGFTECKDSDTPFGKEAEEIIWEHVQNYNYPVCFNFPAGHIKDNHALIFGRKLARRVEKQAVSAYYSE